MYLNLDTSLLRCEKIWSKIFIMGKYIDLQRRQTEEMLHLVVRYKQYQYKCTHVQLMVLECVQYCLLHREQQGTASFTLSSLLSYRKGRPVMNDLQVDALFISTCKQF
jgi:hypothetical protein